MVLELETRLEEARRRIQALEAELERQRQHEHEEVEAVHRQYRRTLVPVTNTVVRVRR
jgi:hypothetical protein